MPHYKDGSEAKIGDVVKVIPEHGVGTTIIGPVLTVYAGTNTCNLYVGEGIQVVVGDGGRVVFPHRGMTVNAKDAEKVA